MDLMPDGLHNIRTDFLSCIHKDHKYNVDYYIPNYCNLCLPFCSSFFIRMKELVLCIFHIDSIYILLSVPFLYAHHHNHLPEQQISIVDSHNENHVHNSCIWSFNFLEIFFIKDTNANCYIITYRPSKLFLF